MNKFERAIRRESRKRTDQGSLLGQHSNQLLRELEKIHTREDNIDEIREFNHSPKGMVIIQSKERASRSPKDSYLKVGGGIVMPQVPIAERDYGWLCATPQLKKILGAWEETLGSSESVYMTKIPFDAVPKSPIRIATTFHPGLGEEAGQLSQFFVGNSHLDKTGIYHRFADLYLVITQALGSASQITGVENITVSPELLAMADHDNPLQKIYFAAIEAEGKMSGTLNSFYFASNFHKPPLHPHRQSALYLLD